MKSCIRACVYTLCNKFAAKEICPKMRFGRIETFCLGWGAVGMVVLECLDFKTFGSKKMTKTSRISGKTLIRDRLVVAG